MPRCGRLEPISPGLGEEARIFLETLRQRHPAWQAREGERADIPGWIESRQGEQGDAALLTETPADQVVGRAAAMASADPWNQGEIWRKFARAEPAKALAGLTAEAAKGIWARETWLPVIWALNETSDPALIGRMIALLGQAPSAASPDIVDGVSDWFLQRRTELRTAASLVDLLNLWDRLVDGVAARPADEASIDEDPLSAAGDRAPGQLVRWLTGELARREPVPGSRLPPDLQPRFDRLMAVPDQAGSIARIALMADLPFLHSIDPDWSEETLLPLLSGNDPLTGHLWTGLIHNQLLGNRRLWRLLKPRFLAAFGVPQLRRHAEEAMVAHLLNIMICVQCGAPDADAPTWLEAKRALTVASPEARRNAAYGLFARMRDAGEAAASLWRRTIGPVFGKIWPMGVGSQSVDATLYIAWMAQRAGEAFPEAVAAILPAIMVSPRTNHSIVDQLDEEEQALFARFPRAALTLIDALVDRENPPDELARRLNELAAADPDLTRDPKFERLLGLVRRMSA